MRSSVAARFSKALSMLFALTLVMGLVPAAAFAAEGDAAAPQEDSWAASAAAENENQPTPDESQDESVAARLVWQENEGGDEGSSEDVPDKSGTYGTTSGDDFDGSDDPTSVLPAGDIINQAIPLSTVAQAESTRSFFLAQTLENTRTVPVVSAKLPIDTSANDAAEGEPSDGASAAEGDGSGEGGDGSDESDPDSSSEGEEPAAPSINPDSVVIGSFEQDGIVYALEPGGETVAVVAVDYAKLPEEYVQKQVLVIPETATPDGYEYYSVTRIAANAFAGLTAENANPDYVGCEALFSDEELLAEAGIDPADVAAFLPVAEDAAGAAKSDESADADSIDMPKTEASGYEDRSTAEESQDESVGASFSLRQDDGESDEQAGAKADENAESDIRTIVSMDGNAATLDDGSTYEFTNPLADCPGILALGIPGSVTSIDDDAFAGFETLQYLVVAEGNPEYASYDGALYSADLSQLRSIPEGRLGAVCVASNVIGVDSGVFSHCNPGLTLVAGADSAAFEAAEDAGVAVVAADERDERRTSVLSALDALCKNMEHRSTSLVLGDSRHTLMASYANNVYHLNYSGCSLTWTDGSGSASVADDNFRNYGAVSYFYLNGEYITYYEVTHGRTHSYKSNYSVSTYPYFYALDGGSFSQLTSGRVSVPESCTAIYIKQFDKVTWDSAGGGAFSSCYVGHGQALSKNRSGLTSLPSPTRSGWAFDGWYTGTDYKTKVTMSTKVTADTTFYARWKIDFNWYAYGSAKGATTTTVYSPGSYATTAAYSTVKVTPPSTLSNTPTGWTLYRWSRSATASSNDVTPGASNGATAYSTSGTNNFYARWQAPIKRNLNYSGQSDTSLTTLYASGQNPTATYAPVSPTRTGYTFKDWTVDYVDASLTDFTAAKDTTITFAGAATLKANWSVNSYKASFSNAGSNKPEQLTKTYEESVALPSPGTNPGYTFGGWKASTDNKVYAEGATYSMKTAASDVTFTAQWSANTITLSWNSQGGSAVANTSKVYGPSEKVPMPGATTKAGYTFAGWWTEADGRGTQVTSSTALPTGDTTYHAHWTANGITLKWDSHGGSAVGDTTQTYGPDVYVKLPDQPSRYGYTFAGWWAAASGAADQVTGSTKLPSSGQTYHARWTANEKNISYSAGDGGGGNGPSGPARLVFDASVTLPQNTYTKRGYHFIGWKANGRDALLQPGSTYEQKIDENVTFAAQWAPDDYTVDLVFTHGDFSSGQGTITLTEQTYDSLISGFDFAVLKNATATSDGGAKTYVFKGFYPVAYGAWSVNDAGHAVNQGSTMGTRYIDEQGTATRVLNEVPGSTGHVVLYALWGYPEVTITFDMQDEALAGASSGALVDKGAGVYNQQLITNDAMPDATGLASTFAQARKGFTFTGFWTHPYRESNTAERYYDEKGACLYNAAGSSTWDQTQGVTLYAHWRYEVRLDANAFNTDGEAVLNGDGDGYDVSVVWPEGVNAAAGSFATDQKNWRDDVPYQTGPVKVQGGDGTASARTLMRYSFTAVDGAPIQLPTLTDRPGYHDSRAWGTKAGSHGAASSIVSLDGSNVTNPFRAQLVLVDDKGTAALDDDEYAFMLYADWRGGDVNLSGKPREYDVQLKATYQNAGDEFRVKNEALAEPVIKVTYDSPIDLSRVTPYQGDGGFNYVDATTDAAGAPRNMSLKGFYTQPGAVGTDPATEGAKRYIGLNDAGDAFSVGAATVSGSVAFRELPVGAGPIPLYAWWTYNANTTVTFDLQGADKLGDKAAAQLAESDLTITGVASHGAIPELTAALKGKPSRNGYVFAGWWNTRYNERTVETVDGVDVTPRRYYDAQADGSVAVAADAPELWLEYADTTLYAHWKYYLSFDVQLPAGDIADVTLDAVKASNEQARVSGVVALDEPGAGEGAEASGDEATARDLYGNVYVKSSAGAGSAATQQLTVTAIAGAPVQLPAAANRRAKEGDGYVKLPYDPTWQWRSIDTDPASVVGFAADEAAAASHFTDRDDSWSTGYGQPGSVPCKLNRTTALTDSTNSQTLYADWTSAVKEFAVQLNYGYRYGDYQVEGAEAPIVYTSGHAEADGVKNPILLVTYDSDDWRYAATGEEFDGPDTAAKAEASFQGGTHVGLDFAGVTTKMNAFAESSKPGANYPTQGRDELYWDAAGNLKISKFRAVRGADVDVYSTENPFPLYVAWAQPSRTVKFDLAFDGEAADSGENVIEAPAGRSFVLRRGEAVDKAGVADQLDELAAMIAEYEEASGYVFGGFWTAPGEHEAYEEAPRFATDDPTERPTCYYVMDDATGKLVAAGPSTGENGEPDGWLTSDNASGIWQENANVVLHAHWKYGIDFRMDSDDVIPGTSPAASDLMLIGPGAYDDAAGAEAPIAFESLDAAAGFVDARGLVTLGAPLSLPVGQEGSQGQNAIVRVRDFAQAPDAYGSDARDRAGYTFRAWSLEQGANAEAVDGIAEGTGELTRAAALKPATQGAAGRVTLRPQWSAITFTVSLDHYPEAMWGGVITEHSVAERGTASVQVEYDGRFPEAITPPRLYGFDYLGYFTAEGGAVDERHDVTGAGLKCFDVPSYVNDPETDGLSAPTSHYWFAPNLNIVDGKGTAELHAYYARNAYAMAFSPRDELDGTLQAVDGRVEGQTAYGQTWHYGDVLAAAGADDPQAGWQAPEACQLEFPASNAGTFSRRGYTFDGWYFYPREHEQMTDEEREALHRDPANRVYLYRVDNSNAADPVGQAGVFTWRESADGADQWVKRADMTTWRTNEAAQLFDAEQGYTLYAGWVPKTYTVTFHMNYQNGFEGEEAEDVTVTKTFAYGQRIQPGELIDPSSEGKPHTFVGWNRSVDAAPDAQTGWLFDKSDYAPATPDQVGSGSSGYPIMSAAAGGLFMPKLSEDGTAEPQAFDLYGVWKIAGDKNVVLFAGDHGNFTGSASKVGADADGVGRFAVVDHEYFAGMRLDLLEDKNWYGIEHDSDNGWLFKGWVELSPEQMGAAAGATSYDGLDRSRDEAWAFAQGAFERVNAGSYATASANELFPEAFNVRDKSVKYVNKYTKSKVEFRDIYLVAAYERVEDYKIVLDMGPASGDDVRDGFNIGPRIEGDALFPARTVEDGRVRSSYQFNVDRPDFTLPDPVSDWDDFAGWFKDEACTVPLESSFVDVAEYVANAKKGLEATTYYAKWEPKKFRIVFKSDHPDTAAGDASEDVVLHDLGYEDEFTLPQPATRGEGGIFHSWGLLRDGTPASAGTFAAGTKFKAKELLFAMRKGEYVADDGTKTSLTKVIMGEDNTLTFVGAWLKEGQGAISVAVPTTVNVYVDLENGNVRTADNLAISTTQAQTDPNKEDVKVVGLRYDRVNTAAEHGAGGQFVFDDVPGQVYLSVYADLQLAGADTGWMFYSDNMAEDGSGMLKTGVVGEQKPPLLIDLVRDAVFAEHYPSVSEGSDAYYEGDYDPAHEGLAGHGLDDHGFRAFSVANPLPIRYGLMFKGIEARDVDLLAALGAQSDKAYPIARLFYTISKV